MSVASEPLDNLDWLMGWYGSQCDEDWEHSYGVKIDTLDNPGWSLKIDLRETSLHGKTFEAVEVNALAADGDPPQSWYICRVADDCFEGFGGVNDLSTLIGIFRTWAS